MRIQSTHRQPTLSSQRSDLRVESAPSEKLDTVEFSGATKPSDIWNDGRPWETRNQPAALVREDGNRKTYSGFRWGWNEQPKVEDWTPNFQETTIDTGKLKDVHFYVEHFFPAGHGALVFEFEDGAVQGADGQSTNKMVYSIEARKKEGDEWTWKRGLKKTMGMVHQLMTFDDAEQWVTRRQGASLETRRLNLTEQEKKALLDTALDEAIQDRTGEYYHTTRNSCYSGLLRVMGKALPDKDIGVKSPLSLGTLMKPEAVMTSNYNTVMKGMGIYSREKAQYYLPDAELHPSEHTEGLKKAFKTTFVESVASSRLFAPGMRLGGAGVGAGLGYVIGSQLGLGPIGTTATTAILGYMGNRSGAIAGDLMEGNALRVIANADLSKSPVDL